MKHICDGHEYTTTESRGHMDLFNNYGTMVAVGEMSPCSEYWQFSTTEGIDQGSSDSYHVGNMSPDFTPEQQLVRWYTAVTS